METTRIDGKYNHVMSVTSVREQAHCWWGLQLIKLHT